MTWIKTPPDLQEITAESLTTQPHSGQNRAEPPSDEQKVQTHSGTATMSSVQTAVIMAGYNASFKLFSNLN